MDRIDEPECRQTLWIVGRHGEPVDDRRHVLPRTVVQLVPVGPRRRRAQGFEGSPVVAAVGEFFCDAREAPDRGCAGPCSRECLEIERRPRGLVSRKPPELERCAKEPHRLLRAAELVREIARPREAAARAGADRRSARQPAPAPRTQRRGRREASPDLPQHRAPKRPPRPALVRPPPGARRPGPDRLPASARAQHAPAGVARPLLPDGQPT